MVSQRNRLIISRFSALFKVLLTCALLLGPFHYALNADNVALQENEIASQPAENGGDYEKKDEIDVGKVIIDHILDGYDWHIADWGDIHFSIPLPVILIYEGKFNFFFSHKFNHGYDAYKGFKIAKEAPRKGQIIRVLEDGVTRDPNASMIIDLSLTKNSLSILIGSTLLIILMIKVAKIYKKNGDNAAPKGVAGFIEPLVLFVKNDIAISAIGERHYQKFLPYLLTVFFFIFLNNLLGLIPIFPGGANSTGNIGVTFVLAMFTFFMTQISGNRTYWQHIFNTPGVPIWLKLPIPLMPIIEIVGVLIKPIPLMLRLFANITAGHMIILGFLSLIFVLGQTSAGLGWGISVLTVVFVIFMNFLELLVAFLQAYIFTMFSAVFFGLAVPEDHH